MLVSILIPCFNAAQWVGQAIESALEQDYPEIEILFYDDGSTDHSLNIASRYEKRIEIHRGLKQGSNHARNELLHKARGEWLQYLDADDYLLPGKVSAQVEHAQSMVDSDIVYGPSIHEYWNGKNAHRSVIGIPEPRDPWILLARWYLPQTGAVLWRKSAIEDVNGWNPDQSVCQEHELYFRLMKSGKKFTYCSSAESVYRQWGEHTLSKRDMSAVWKARLQIEKNIEDYLRKQNKLSPGRLWAINMARFEMARAAWHSDRVESKKIYRLIESSQPGFKPYGMAAPTLYRFVHNQLGFEQAEKIAGWRRNVLGIIRWQKGYFL